MNNLDEIKLAVNDIILVKLKPSIDKIPAAKEALNKKKADAEETETPHPPENFNRWGIGNE